MGARIPEHVVAWTIERILENVVLVS